MTNKKLNEYKEKFVKGEGNINDLGEVVTDFYLAMSKVISELKSQNTEIQSNQKQFHEEIQTIKDLMNPVFTIIQAD
jgi:DNA replication initiation complex subunit (GINS family)